MHRLQMDFHIEDADVQPRIAWKGEGTTSPSEGLVIQRGKVRGGCGEDIKRLLTAVWWFTAECRTRRSSQELARAAVFGV